MRPRLLPLGPQELLLGGIGGKTPGFMDFLIREAEKLMLPQSAIRLIRRLLDKMAHPEQRWTARQPKPGRTPWCRPSQEALGREVRHRRRQPGQEERSVKGLHRSTVCRSLRLLVDKGLLQAKKRSRPGLPEHGHGWRLSNWYTLGRTAYAIWGRWCREIAKQMSGFRMDQFEEAYRRIHAWVTAFSSPAVLFLRQLWAGPSVPAPGSPAAAGPPAPPAAGPDPAHSLAEIERLIQEAREAREEIKRMRPSPDPRTPTPPKPEDGS